MGFAMDLWSRVALEAGMEFEVRVVDTAQQMIDELAQKRADVGVGALSVTAKREGVIDFSQPFYEAGLQILVRQEAGSFADSIFSLIRNLFNIKLIAAFTLLIVAMLGISHFVWMFEHKVNGDMWPQDYRKGLWESFWWTVSTLLVGGADNKGPVGVGGRIVAIMWMLLSIVLVSLLTASFTTTLTVSSLKGGISGPGDLPGKKVATIQGSTSESWLTNRGAVTETFPVIADAVAALKQGKVDALVFDAPILQYSLGNMQDSNLVLVGPIFERQNYAFGLQQGSILKEPINRALLDLYERGVGSELRKKWFGSEM